MLAKASSNLTNRLTVRPDYTTYLYRQHAEVIDNHENEDVCSIRQGEARHRKYKRLKLGGGQGLNLVVVRL
jgi:hypothetical protein